MSPLNKADVIKVLFVEDDPDQIFLYQEVFGMKGIFLIPSTNSKETLEAAIKNKPAVILLDILLRHENGLDIMEKLKANGATKNIPVIIFTNYDKKEVRDRAAELGAVAFIIKSRTTPQEMIEKVKALITIPHSSNEEGQGAESE